MPTLFGFRLSPFYYFIVSFEINCILYHLFNDTEYLFEYMNHLFNDKYDLSGLIYDDESPSFH